MNKTLKNLQSCFYFLASCQYVGILHFLYIGWCFMPDRIRIDESLSDSFIPDIHLGVMMKSSECVVTPGCCWITSRVDVFFSRLKMSCCQLNLMHFQGWERLAEGRQNHLLQTRNLEKKDTKKDKRREVEPVEAYSNCVGERGTPPAEQWDDTKPGGTEVLSSFS